MNCQTCGKHFANKQMLSAHAHRCIQHIPLYPDDNGWKCTCCTGEHQEPSDDEIESAVKEVAGWIA